MSMPKNCPIGSKRKRLAMCLTNFTIKLRGWKPGLSRSQRRGHRLAIYRAILADLGKQGRLFEALWISAPAWLKTVNKRFFKELL